MTYTVRLIATDAQGPSTGAPITFRTLPPPPRISKLGVRITRRHGRRQAALRLTVSQAAIVLFGFEHKQAKRWVPLKRTLTARVKAGTFTMGLSLHGLKRGSYRIAAVAANAVGERSAVQRATFSISR